MFLGGGLLFYNFLFLFKNVLTSTIKFIVQTPSRTPFKVLCFQESGPCLQNQVHSGTRLWSSSRKFLKQLARNAVGGTGLLRRASPRVFGEIAGEREGEGLRGNRKAKVSTRGAVRRRGSGAFRWIGRPPAVSPAASGRAVNASSPGEGQRLFHTLPAEPSLRVVVLGQNERWKWGRVPVIRESEGNVF